MVGQHRGRRLPVAPRDANHAGVGIAARQFNLRDDMRPLRLQALDDRRLVGDAGAFHHLVGREDTLLRVPAFFPLDAMRVEHSLVLGLYRAAVRDKHLEALRLGKDGCTRAALACTQYYNLTHIFVSLKSFLHLSGKLAEAVNGFPHPCKMLETVVNGILQPCKRLKPP